MSHFQLYPFLKCVTSAQVSAVSAPPAIWRSHHTKSINPAHAQLWAWQRNIRSDRESRAAVKNSCKVQVLEWFKLGVCSVNWILGNNGPLAFLSFLFSLFFVAKALIWFNRPCGFFSVTTSPFSPIRARACVCVLVLKLHCRGGTSAFRPSSCAEENPDTLQIWSKRARVRCDRILHVHLMLYCALIDGWKCVWAGEGETDSAEGKNTHKRL